MAFPLLFFVLLFILLGAVPTWGSMLSNFRPRMLRGIAMDLTVEGDYSSEVDQTNTSQSEDEDVTLRESVNLSSIGYVYHPNLVLYEVSGSFDLDQRLESTNGVSDQESGVNTRGALDVLMFRRKPYNLKAYVSKERPFRFQTLGSSDSEGPLEQFEYGLETEYRTKPWFYTMAFDSTDQERGSRLDGNDNLRLSVWYSGEGFNFSIYFDHTASQNESDELTSNDATSDRIEFTNGWQLGRFFFDTSGSVMFSKSNSYWATTETFPLDELGPNGETEYSVTTKYSSGEKGKDLSFSEDIDIELPMSLESEISYSYDYEKDSPFGDDASDTDTFREQQIADFNLTHKLFESVTTTTEANLDMQGSSGGDFLTHTYQLTSEYVKRLPGGAVSGAISNRLNFSQRHGRPSYEDIQSGIEESFYLRTSADPATLSISVLDQSCDGKTGSNYSTCIALETSWVPLTENIHYTLDSSGQPILVELDVDVMEILDLDGDNYTGTLSEGPYTLRVNYSLEEADYSVQSNMSSLSGSLTLLDGAVSSFLKHTTTSQEYTEGDAAYGELSPTVINNEIGIILYWYGAKFTSSYAMLDSDTKQDTWDTVLEYSRAFPLSARLGFDLNLLYQYTLQDVAAEGITASSQRDIYSASLGVNFAVPELSSVVLGSSSYTSYRGGTSGVYYNEEENLWLAEPDTDEDRDYFDTTMTMAMIIPKVTVNCSLSAYYNFENNLTDQSERTEFGYSVNLSRLWTFGATSLELTGAYSSSEIEDIDFLEQTESLDQTETLKLHFLLTRKF